MNEAIFGSVEALNRFCTSNIEVIDADADEYQIIGLHNVFEIPIRIYNLSNTSTEKVYIFKLPDNSKPLFNFCRWGQWISKH